MTTKPKARPKAQAALAALNMKKKNQANMSSSMRQIATQGQKLFGSKSRGK